MIIFSPCMHTKLQNPVEYNYGDETLPVNNGVWPDV